MGAGLIVAGQDGDLPIEMPDLDVVAVDKFLRGFDGGVVVGCLDNSGGLEVAVISDDVGAVVWHGCHFEQIRRKRCTDSQ
jgi:hypothetical protein